MVSFGMVRGYAVILLIAAILLPAASGPAFGQTGGGHILFGDLKIDERNAPGLRPQTFVVSLLSLGGDVISRQSVSGNGRYRFLDVRNGDYYLLVEMGNDEVARIQLLLMEKMKTDIRRDIELEWQPGPAERTPARPGVVSVGDFHPRDDGNARLLEDALGAVKGGEYRRAVSLLNAVVAADPHDFEAWTELGTARFMLGERSQAEEDYRRALKERPAFFPALLNLGKLRIAQKEYSQAVETLGNAVELDAGHAEAHFLLGEAHLQTRKGSVAERYFREALRLDPDGQAQAHLRLGALYHAAGLRGRAAAEYEQFLARRPDFPEKKQLEDYIRRHKP
ncbi:MAG: tetratricopeptide repeat protein [Acidobacteria bacterium]|nr:tetratricopeptide repeat protein [Acidobacteriota bacterium]